MQHQVGVTIRAAMGNLLKVFNGAAETVVAILRIFGVSLVLKVNELIVVVLANVVRHYNLIDQQTECDKDRSEERERERCAKLWPLRKLNFKHSRERSQHRHRDDRKNRDSIENLELAE